MKISYPDLLKKLLVPAQATIKETMRKIDESGLGLAFIIDNEQKLKGVATDGDIRRAILNGIDIDKNIEEIMNMEPVTVINELTKEKEVELLKDEKIKRKLPILGLMKIPILDENGKVSGIAFLTEKGETIKDKLKSKIPSEQHALKKILVVGGASYLGSVLCRKLLAKGYQVRTIDNLMYGDEGIKELYENPNFQLIKGDMRNLQTVMKAVNGTDAVIHLAAIVGDPASALNPAETIEINYLATKLLAEVCKYSQINRFIFASTCSVYGASSTPDERLTEESILNPVSLYANMKIKSEQAILELVDENFSPTILRMSTLFGLSPRMRFDLVINILTAKAVVDKEITVFGGNQWRPFIHVEDAADAYVKCLEIPINKIRGMIFNVGVSEMNFQIIKIGEKIKNIIKDAKIIVDDSSTDQRDYNVSFDKILQVLGFKSNFEVEDAINEIKEALVSGRITNYKDKKYSNFKFLSNKNELN